ncbi:cytochrome C oxidase subunit IV family protein [Pseudomonas sp. FP453]|uniref:cytochrome C oxidase subunit IV family protein n=1 Tax=Pseudomonas sp. FP453 TaxID=2954094 RepID=UPI00273240D4|nr:cytochrome C oxidase subunit IV family protein [Pseudomonas sp. FP453]WLH88107.1 cytochrome C oxidase subunit IV family protein [Pseudomonas sp. FP453]
MSASQGLLVCWAVLVSLSAGTVLAGAAGVWLVVLLLAASKAWLIADGFMELRHAPWGWRGMLLGWAVVLVLLIGVIC